MSMIIRLPCPRPYQVHRREVERSLIYRLGRMSQWLSGRYGYWRNRPLDILLSTLMNIGFVSTFPVVVGLTIGEREVVNIEGVFERLMWLVAFVSVAFFCYLSTMRRPQEFEAMHTDLATNWLRMRKKARTHRELQIMDACDKMAETLSKVSDCMCYSGAFFMSAAPLGQRFVFSEEDITLPLEIYMPFVDSFIVKYALTVVYIFYIFKSVCSLICMFICYLLYIEAMLHVNYIHFDDAFVRILDTAEKRMYRFYKRIDVELISVIEEQQLLYRLANGLHQFVDAGTLFFLPSAAFLCTSSIFIVNQGSAHHIKLISVVALPLTQLCALFITAAKATERSRKTSTLVYGHLMTFVERRYKLDRSLTLLLLRTQRPVSFRAGKILRLSLPNFVMFFRQMYSVYALFNSLSTREVTLTSA